jgi:[ribosomal protein S18]-alanine N-acetyltransferase
VSYGVLPITVAQAATVSGWRYPAPYDVYDMGPEAVPGLLAPKNAYHAVLDGTDLVGFCCFGPDAQVPVGRDAGWYGPDGLDVGLGMRPDLTGRGRGAGFLAAVLAEASHRSGTLRLTVATFNARAQRLYLSAGFAAVAVSPDARFRLLTRGNPNPGGQISLGAATVRLGRLPWRGRRLRFRYRQGGPARVC